MSGLIKCEKIRRYHEISIYCITGPGLWEDNNSMKKTRQTRRRAPQKEGPGCSPSLNRYIRAFPTSPDCRDFIILSREQQKHQKSCVCTLRSEGTWELTGWNPNTSKLSMNWQTLLKNVVFILKIHFLDSEYFGRLVVEMLRSERWSCRSRQQFSNEYSLQKSA